MTTPFDTLPTIAGYEWRTPQPDDAAPLAALEAACAKVDGNKSVTDAATWQKRLSDAAFREKNVVVLGSIDGDLIHNIVAAGRLWYQEEAHEIQGFLDGWVHSTRRHQRIGSALLAWLEARSCTNMRTRLIELGTPNLPRVCRLLIYHQAPHALQLYADHGFTFQNVEDELHIALAHPPTLELPAELTVEPYRVANALDFHAAYLDAFSTRTSDLWNEESWRYHFADPNDGEFVPRVSLLAKLGDQVVGFAVCHREDDISEADGNMAGSIDVTQLGVGVNFRQRGYAAAILAETLRRCAAAGYPLATISVNANNAGARRVYERVGFVLHERFMTFRKAVDNSPERMAG